MSDEISLAFGHPVARAEATAPDGPLDRISLRDHIVEVEIGAFQAERGKTQRVQFNIVVGNSGDYRKDQFAPRPST